MLSNEVFTTEAWYKREHFDGLADPTDPTPVLKAFKVSRRFSDNSAKRTKSLKYPSPDRNSEAPSTKLLNIFRGKYSKSGSETERRKQSMSMSEETERIKAILGQDSHRPRSHSELPQKYSILKKESHFGPLTVLGMIDHNSPNILKKVLNHFTCYDIMPSSSMLVVGDSKLSLSKVLEILVKRCFSEIVIWDSVKQEYLGCITLKDIASYVFPDVRDLKNRLQITVEEFLSCLNDSFSNSCNEDFFKHLIEPNTNLKEAAQLLIGSDRDIIYVWDCDNGNVISNISSTSFLQFLQFQFSKIGSHMIDTNHSVEFLMDSVNCNQFVHSKTSVKDALIKFKTNDIIYVFADTNYKTFLKPLSFFDLASFFIDIRFDELPEYLKKQMWIMLDLRKKKKMKTTSYFVCNLHTSIVKACECMLLSKSDGIVVSDNHRIPVGFISQKNILAHFLSMDKSDDKSFCEKMEIMRM